MSEADILEQIMAMRLHLDATIAQVIGITFTLIIAIYYFLHRSGVVMKLAVLAIYAIGWTSYLVSGMLTMSHLSGLLQTLKERVAAGEASTAAAVVLESFDSPLSRVMIAGFNAVTGLMLAVAIGFLLFWKKPQDEGLA
ncbi:MAG: hypothetical protein AAGH42_11215 [Pseudomonadota bacterium]